MAKFSWIKIKCLENDVTQKVIAARVGVEYDTFLKIVNNFRRPPEGFVEKVKKAFAEIEEQHANAT